MKPKVINNQSYVHVSSLTEFIFWSDPMNDGEGRANNSNDLENDGEDHENNRNDQENKGEDQVNNSNDQEN